MYRTYDGEYFVTFWIYDISIDRIATIATTRAGRTTMSEYCLFCDEECGDYFEYGPEYTKIYLEDFED